MSYSVKVIDHYENPRNVGSFGKDDDGVGTGMVGAPALRLLFGHCLVLPGHRVGQWQDGGSGDGDQKYRDC